MELTSRLGEYGSVGAGGADCAAENETMASTTNGRQAMSSFLIGVLVRNFCLTWFKTKRYKRAIMILAEQRFANNKDYSGVFSGSRTCSCHVPPTSCSV